VRSSVIREELGLEPLLLYLERSQLRWFGHLARMPTAPPLEVFHNVRSVNVKDVWFDSYDEEGTLPSLAMTRVIQRE
jgi:hypothetical protein